MRCVECQKDTVSPHRHCECCGRELVASTASTESSPALEAKPAAVRHCAICGAPSGDGECCDNCFNSFDAWVGGGPSVAPAAEPIAPSTVGKTDRIDALWSELMNTPAPPQSEFVAVEPSPKAASPMPSVPRTPAAAAYDVPRIAAPVPAPQAPLLAPPVQMPSPPQAAPPVLPSEPTRTPASAPDVAAGVLVEPIKIEPVRPPVAAPRAEPAANAARSTPKPPAVVRSRPKSRSKNLWALPSAMGVLGAVVYGGYWLQVHGFLSRESKPEAPVAASERARDPQLAPRSAERANPNPPARTESAPRQVKTQAASPRPAGRQASAVAPKPRPARVAVPAPIPAASVALPAVVTTLPEPPPLAASTAPSSAPQGPFFEPTQVNEAPRVASRVAPDVPQDLRGHARNEIVIVRMLVSQVGRPSRVSLLRKSKAGPRVDDAVIAAVNQWTFSPARRKGEAVSSWFNIGIPVLAD